MNLWVKGCPKTLSVIPKGAQLYFASLAPLREIVSCEGAKPAKKSGTTNLGRYHVQGNARRQNCFRIGK